VNKLPFSHIFIQTHTPTHSLSLSISLSFPVCTCSFAKSCLTLCNSMDCSHLVPSVCGIFQARILEWVALSYSKGSSWPMYWTYVSHSSCTGRWIIYHWANSSNLSLFWLNFYYLANDIYSTSLSFCSCDLECLFQLDSLIKILCNFQSIFEMSNVRLHLLCKKKKKNLQHWCGPVTSFCSCLQTHTTHGSDPHGIIIHGGYCRVARRQTHFRAQEWARV